MSTPDTRSGEPMSLEKQITHQRAIELLYLALCVGRSREGEKHEEIWSDIKTETLNAMIDERSGD
jgi:hypothetical protein